MSRLTLREYKEVMSLDDVQFACRVNDLPIPEKEHRFTSTRKWRLDYAWPSYRVALEVHGGVWQQGRHTRGQGFKNDRQKMNEAQVLGWIVLEVAAEDATSASTLALIKRALDARR